MCGVAPYIFFFLLEENFYDQPCIHASKVSALVIVNSYNQRISFNKFSNRTVHWKFTPTPYPLYT